MTRFRIGIFGGTFDPVHQGHIEVARRLRARLSLDWIEFVPAYRPPHKLSTPEADAWDRFAMLILATKEDEDLYVSTIELEAAEAVYTIDTIRQLKPMWGARAELYFIIGADSFEEITTWKEYEHLLNSCHFAVVTRPGYSVRAENLPESIRERIVDLRDGFPGDQATEGYRIYLCRDVWNPISSTAIRHALKHQQQVDGLIPVVQQFIEKYQLYRDEHEAQTAKTTIARADKLGRKPHYSH
jgi:nicotinate-nucleotide adenylyltransferase